MGEGPAGIGIARLTEGGRVVVARAVKSDISKERHQLRRRSLVNALPFGQRVQSVEHFEQPGARLMDSANYRPPSSS